MKHFEQIFFIIVRLIQNLSLEKKFNRMIRIINRVFFIISNVTKNDSSMSSITAATEQDKILKKSPTRKVMSSDSKCLLSEWLKENSEFPYPSIEAKRDLSIKTHLSVKQVSRWFENERNKQRKLTKSF
jgi:hypothetical protein